MSGSCWARRVPLAFIVPLLLIVASCASAPASTGSPVPQPEDNQLKVGLLPIPEALPMWVAERDGYFTAEGLNVTLINFASAVERDAALQVGQLHGQLNDPISVGLLNKEQTLVKIVRLAVQGKAGQAMISVVVQPSSKAQTAADLKGGEIALSQNTIIEYVVDAHLQRLGINPSDVKKVEVPKIPLRLEMLSRGQVAAAGLPEPFVTLAVSQGGRTLFDDALTGLGQSAITFRTDAIAQKTNAIKRFLKAYERAVVDINTNPQRYSTLFVEKAMVPDAVKEKFAVRVLPVASVPAEAELKAIMDWMTAKGLLARKLAYGDLVDATLLPK